MTVASGPKSQQCGWLEDKFGVSWQVVPTIVNEVMSGPDPEKGAGRWRRSSR